MNAKVKLYVDLFYVNGLVFMAVKSDDITNYLAIDNMDNKYAATIIKHLSTIIKKFTSRGFTISDIFADGEFETDDIITSVVPATLHICSADEHVPKIERAIRTIKERARTVCHTLTYDAFPMLMTTSLTRNIVKWKMRKHLSI